MPNKEELFRHYSRVYTGSHNQLEIQEKNAHYYESHIQELVRISGVTPSRATIADYGSSYPILLMKAKEAAFAGTLGIEYDRASSDFGTQHGIRMMTPDELCTQVPDRSVDIMRFSHVLEHLIDPLDILKSIHSKMKIGGLLYITQPNFPVFFSKECTEDLSDSVWPEHLHFFSPVSLCELVTRAGYQVTRVFSHQNAEIVYSRYSHHVDHTFANQKLSEYSSRGDGTFGKLCNYPFYAGENAVLYGKNVK